MQFLKHSEDTIIPMDIRGVLYAKSTWYGITHFVCVVELGYELNQSLESIRPDGGK
jgi:hypothetical protein